MFNSHLSVSPVSEQSQWKVVAYRLEIFAGTLLVWKRTYPSVDINIYIKNTFISAFNQLDVQNFLFYNKFVSCLLCSKHVETWNKLIVKKNVVHQVG